MIQKLRLRTYYILADCASAEDLNHYILTLAIIAQNLVCCMGNQVHRSESGIRTLYSTWADIAVEQFEDPRALPCRKHTDCRRTDGPERGRCRPGPLRKCW